MTIKTPPKPLIVWKHYPGSMGWQPLEFDTIEEALERLNLDHGDVLTKRLTLSVVDD